MAAGEAGGGDGAGSARLRLVRRDQRQSCDRRRTRGPASSAARTSARRRLHRPHWAGGPRRRLVPSDGVAFAIFGHSVAISGTTVVVGAPFGGVRAARRTSTSAMQADSGSSRQSFAHPSRRPAIGSDTRSPSVATTSSQDPFQRVRAAPRVSRMPTRARPVSGPRGRHRSRRRGDRRSVRFLGRDQRRDGNHRRAGKDHRDQGRTGRGLRVREERRGVVAQGGKLPFSGGAERDFFGGSVAVSGETAVVQFQNQLNAGNRRHRSSCVRRARGRSSRRSRFRTPAASSARSVSAATPRSSGRRSTWRNERRGRCRRR
ncbi:MAG: hypothetical protein U0842_17695 [Candidatus Binatia bacterium]